VIPNPEYVWHKEDNSVLSSGICSVSRNTKSSWEFFNTLDQIGEVETMQVP
jgi:hypothetical protein